VYLDSLYTHTIAFIVIVTKRDVNFMMAASLNCEICRQTNKQRLDSLIVICEHLCTAGVLHYYVT